MDRADAENRLPWTFLRPFARSLDVAVTAPQWWKVLQAPRVRGFRGFDGRSRHGRSTADEEAAKRRGARVSRSPSAVTSGVPDPGAGLRPRAGGGVAAWRPKVGTTSGPGRSLRACLVVLCLAWCRLAPAGEADPINLSRLAHARASDEMDGAHGAGNAVDGDAQTLWTVWEWHVPKERKDVWLELTFWRSFRVKSVEIRWHVRPAKPVLSVRAGGAWKPATVQEKREGTVSWLRWSSPRDISGFRISAPRPDGILIREVLVHGHLGAGTSFLDEELPPPAPAPGGIGELPSSFSQADGVLDIALDGGPEVSRLEVDWSRAAKRTLLELTTAAGEILLAPSSRFRTSWDLTRARSASRVRVVSLESAGSEARARHVRVLGPRGRPPSASGALKLWTRSALRSVRRRDPGPRATERQALAITLARNEYEAGQVVLRNEGATASVRDVRLRIDDLRSDGGRPLSSRHIRWSPLGYVNHEHAEVLLESASFDVPPRSSRAVWITVHAPLQQPPGVYRGAVVVQQPGHDPRRVALAVTVWPLTLPVRTGVESTYFSIWGVDGFLGESLRRPERRARLAREVAEDYARHRLFAGLHPFEEEREAMLAAAEKGDFGELERWASFWRRRGIPFEVSIPWPGDEQRFAFWSRELERRGWTGVVKVTDEPSGRVPSVVEACEKLKKWAPYLRPKSAFKSCPAGYDFSWVGHIREWGYQPRIWNDDAVAAMVRFNREREAAGDRVFWYIHTFLGIDRSPYLRRMYFWALWKYRVRGPMLYSTCEWDYAGVDRCLDDYIVDGGAAGTLLWPGDGKFLGSVQWETLRDGIEDHDLHTLLKGKAGTFVREHGDGPLAREAREALEDTDGVFRVFQNEADAEGFALRMNSGGSPTWAARDRPEDLYAARDRLARLAVELDHAAGGGAVLRTRPRSLSLRTRASRTPSEQTLEVRNVGRGSLDLRVSSDVEWLRVEPVKPDSAVAAGGRRTIRLEWATRNLRPGRYRATVRIEVAGALPASLIVPVELGVEPVSP